MKEPNESAPEETDGWKAPNQSENADENIEAFGISEYISTESFTFYCDEETKELFDPEELEDKIKEIDSDIDSLLGEKNTNTDKVTIFSFSDLAKYEDFVRQKFPEKVKGKKIDSALFYIAPDTGERFILNNTSTEISDDKKSEAMEGYGLTEEEIMDLIKTGSRGGVLSGIAHEKTHLHSFFGGVGNEASPTLWEQEMICIYIGERVRREEGITRFHEIMFKKAKEELNDKETIDLEEDVSWDSGIPSFARFLYPYLERQYGADKLQTLWQSLYKESKKPLSEAIKETYEIDISEIAEGFRQAILDADDFREIDAA